MRRVRRGLVLAGGTASIVMAGLIGWRVPAALDRPDRAAEVAVLRGTLAEVQAEADGLSGQIAEAQRGVGDATSANAAADEATKSQERKITDLKATIARLKKEIAAIGK
jgi:chromosome segregation ATPase